MAPKKSDKTSGMTVTQQQLHLLLKGRPEHLSIVSDDYERVAADVQVAVAALNAMIPSARNHKISVLRMTMTSGMTYISHHQPYAQLTWPFVPLTAMRAWTRQMDDLLRRSARTPAETARMLTRAAVTATGNSQIVITERDVNDRRELLRSGNGAKSTRENNPDDPARPVEFSPISGDYPVTVAPVAVPVRGTDGRETGQTTHVPLLPENCNNAVQALNALMRLTESAVVLIEDFHHVLTPQNPLAAIRLREVASALRKRTDVMVIPITVGPVRVIPDNMKASTLQLDYPLPTEHEIAEMVESATASAERNGIPVSVNKTTSVRIRQSLAGLTERSIQAAFARSIAQTGRFSDSIVPELLKQREQMFKAVAGGAAEFITPPPRFRMAGGENFKALVRRIADIVASGDTAVPVPRGLLVVGKPGTGKTTYFRYLSAETQLPAIKVAIGALGGNDASKLGAIPAAMRAVLQGAQAVGNCILVFDDMLKAIDSTDNAKRGGGTVEYLRAVQALLEWTEDRPGRIILFGTGNIGDLQTEMPEGLIERFPHRFVTREPTLAMRAQIFEIELEKWRLDPSRFDCSLLARHADGWVGRQIRDIVEYSLAYAFTIGEPLSTEHILYCIKEDAATEPVEVGGLRFRPMDALEHPEDLPLAADDKPADNDDAAQSPLLPLGFQYSDQERS